MLLLIKVLYFTTQRKYLIAINVYEDRLLVRANTQVGILYAIPEQDHLIFNLKINNNRFIKTAWMDICIFWLLI